MALAALSSPAAPAEGSRVLRAGAWLAAVAVAALTGALTLRSPQLAATTTIVVGVGAAYLGHRPTGMIALWFVWLFTPGLRRIFQESTGYADSDPLAVAPFLATALLVAIEVVRGGLPRKVRWLMLIAGAGFAIGIPVGLSAPQAASFAALAYAAGLGAVVLGYKDGTQPVAKLTLPRALALGAPLLAAYGLYQYYVGLPGWDKAWLASVEFGSAGAPEEGKTRIFAALNSPGTLALVLAVALLCILGRERLEAPMLPVLGLLLVALALTYVRSAWLGFAVATVVFALCAGRAAVPRVLVMGLVLVAGVAALQVGGSTTTAFTERVNTLGALGSDMSANARAGTPAQLLPEIARQPVGYGLGSAGEASRLRTGKTLRTSDNGYLSMAYQLGFVGAVLVLGTFLWAVVSALRRVGTCRHRLRGGLLASVLVGFAVMLLAGDQFYGLPGIILWYFVGVSLAPEDPLGDGS